VVIDMSVDGSGEWQQWDNASFFGAESIWTTLHDFGGTDGMKGDLSRINRIPFDTSARNIIGTGYTPEGIDQNPVYYEFMADANFRTAPVDDLIAHTILRSHRRYGLTQLNENVASAWTLLSNSLYTQDLSVQDHTGIPHLPGSDEYHFLPDRRTPTPKMCLAFQAWAQLIAAAPAVSDTLEPFRYDLINLGREILAQLSVPISQNFSDAYNAGTISVVDVQATSALYIALLQDADTLVQADTAFLLGPWLQSARAFGANSSDCDVMSCGDFYEWNARVQLTTWNPTPKGAKAIPGGPVDYASKHWSGLIRDYYAVRAGLVRDQALTDARAGRSLNHAAVDEILANLAYSWTTDTNTYPTQPIGSPIALSRSMYEKYAPYFSLCKS
jgi:alpha-N-acetylglucosaminidase